MTRAEFDAACADLEMAYFGYITQTSGIRTPDHNEAVGGASTSKHLIGMARDYEIVGKFESVPDALANDTFMSVTSGKFPYSYQRMKDGKLIVHVQGAHSAAK